MDDVYNRSGDFADAFFYDIYPYFNHDLRYGEFGKRTKPRISQMHYPISQLRNHTTTYDKELGFWVGTYNKAWFHDFMGSEFKSQCWAERELAYTATAHGAHFLVTGFGIPEDARHWEDFVQAMDGVHMAGPGLLAAPKVNANAKACFFFPVALPKMSPLAGKGSTGPCQRKAVS